MGSGVKIRHKFRRLRELLGFTIPCSAHLANDLQLQGHNISVGNIRKMPSLNLNVRVSKFFDDNEKMQDFAKFILPPRMTGRMPEMLLLILLLPVMATQTKMRHQSDRRQSRRRSINSFDEGASPSPP